MGAYTNFWTEAETGGRLEGEGARVWCTESGGRQLPLPAKKFPLFPAPPAHIYLAQLVGKRQKQRRPSSRGVVGARIHSLVPPSTAASRHPWRGARCALAWLLLRENAVGATDVRV